MCSQFWKLLSWQAQPRIVASCRDTHNRGRCQQDGPDPGLTGTYTCLHSTNLLRDWAHGTIVAQGFLSEFVTDLRSDVTRARKRRQMGPPSLTLRQRLFTVAFFAFVIEIIATRSGLGIYNGKPQSVRPVPSIDSYGHAIFIDDDYFQLEVSSQGY
ncbi:hypothetical protein BDZ89DRAFT_207212 [Hymenopellis radicata]|nr:hypothetical protein BDZ89DRAFT_207212 [Hymenopellis radicata]